VTSWMRRKKLDEKAFLLRQAHISQMLAG
jgi:hypothetical protein